MNNINASIQTTNRELVCGPECQTDKRAQTLKLAYDNAMNDYLESPELINQIERDFYVETKGIDYYNQLINTRNISDSSNYSKSYETEFKDIKSNIVELIADYDSGIIHFNRIIDLYNKVNSENQDLKQTLDSLTGNINTNNRKTYYEDQQIDRLAKWRKYIYLVYYVVVFVLCVIVFGIQKRYGDYRVYIKIILIIITPVLLLGIIKYIVIHLYELYLHIKRWLALKDVYSDISKE